MTPTLKKIDLDKRCWFEGCGLLESSGDRPGHPDIREGGTCYLAKIDGRWYAGAFTMQHYGWNFDAVYDAGYQLWYSGLSPKKDGWQELYEIVGSGYEKEKRRRKRR